MVVHASPSGRGPGVAPIAFRSVLFPKDGGTASQPAVPHFGDLHLDQVLTALAPDLAHNDAAARLFCSPVACRETVDYRHGLLRDMQQPAVLAAIRDFVTAMDAVSHVLEEGNHSHHRVQQQSLFIEAVHDRCAAVASCAATLAELPLHSQALLKLREALWDLVTSAAFLGRAAGARDLRRATADLRYTVSVKGSRVTVARYEGQRDTAPEMRSTFARFRQDHSEPARGLPSSSLRLNLVESQILDGVEALHPELFEARATFCAAHESHADEVVSRFDDEIRFPLAWLDLIRPLQAAGLPFCLPEIVEPTGALGVEAGFDLALALSLLPNGQTVVTNGFELSGLERLLVVTGPNNGGKTTFARMFGQLLHLAGLGLPLPGTRAWLPLTDRILTHFEVEEAATTHLGRFQEELRRVDEILNTATSRSAIILNESFSSTSLERAVQVGTRVVEAITELGCVGVYVTFMDELASLSDATVSMVAQVQRDDAATRTHTVARALADGQAHAWAIAEKYGLTHERLVKRVQS